MLSYRASSTFLTLLYSWPVCPTWWYIRIRDASGFCPVTCFFPKAENICSSAQPSCQKPNFNPLAVVWQDLADVAIEGTWGVGWGQEAWEAMPPSPQGHEELGAWVGTRCPVPAGGMDFGEDAAQWLVLPVLLKLWASGLERGKGKIKIPNPVSRKR